MRKTISRLVLVTLVMGLLSSCETIYGRLDDLEGRIDGIENETIKSIEGQISSISQSIADLSAIRTSIQTSIQSLTSTVEGRESDLAALEVADEALGGRIDQLRAYVNDSLKLYAKSDWVNATFSTLKQYEETCDTIAKIDVRIGALDTKLSQDIANCKDTLTSWINKQFESYYTVAQMDAKLEALQAAIDTSSAENKANIDSLAAELTEAKAAVDSAKANIRAEYRAAIDTAITALDGKLSKALQEKIDSVNTAIAALEGRVKTLELQVYILAGRITELEKRIQSVSIIPAYSDGSVKVENDSLFIDCEITPASAVKSLTKDNFSILVSKVVTKAVSLDTIRIARDEDFTKDAATGKVSFKVRIKEAYPTSTDQTITVALNLNSGLVDLTSEFMKVSGTGVNLPSSYSITDAQNYVVEEDDFKSKDIDLTNVTIKNEDVAEDGTIHFILKTTSPPDQVSFTLPAIPEELSGNCTGWTIEYEEGYPTENVVVNAPEGTVVTIKAPTSHVVVTGTSYANIIASTDYNTLVIPVGVTVDTLTVKKGSVEIHGTVTNLTVSPEPGMDVYFRKCEGLSEAVFGKIKGEGFNFIDAAFVEKKNGDKWDIILKDDPMGFLPFDFSVSDSKNVKFTKGNLISSGDDFNVGVKGLSGNQTFFWSSVSGNATAVSYSDGNASTGDSFFTEDKSFGINGQSEIWHTMSADQWQSLFNNFNSKWSKVGGVDGVVIATSKNGEIKDEYDEDEWEQAEARGYIFLPVTNEGKDEILYWSSTPDSSDASKAQCVYMKKPAQQSGSQIDAANIIQSKERSSKGAIRLVTYTQDPSVGIDIEKFNDRGNL